MAILYAGIDLAKRVFAPHGVDAGGAVVLRQPRVARAKLHELVAALPPCTISIEACAPGCQCGLNWKKARLDAYRLKRKK